MNKLQEAAKKAAETIKKVDGTDGILIMAISKRDNAIAGCVDATGDEIVAMILSIFENHPELEHAVAQARLIELTAKHFPACEDCEDCEDAEKCENENKESGSISASDLDALKDAFK